MQINLNLFDLLLSCVLSNYRNHLGLASFRVHGSIFLVDPFDSAARLVLFSLSCVSGWPIRPNYRTIVWLSYLFWARGRCWPNCFYDVISKLDACQLIGEIVDFSRKVDAFCLLGSHISSVSYFIDKFVCLALCVWVSKTLRFNSLFVLTMVGTRSSVRTSAHAKKVPMKINFEKKLQIQRRTNTEFVSRE